MKAKVHHVQLFDRSFLIMARSKAGAKRDLFDALKDDAHADVATGQQIYEAGRDGQQIINLDKFANVVDPNQMDLDGLDDERDPRNDEQETAPDAFP